MYHETDDFVELVNGDRTLDVQGDDTASHRTSNLEVHIQMHKWYTGPEGDSIRSLRCEPDVQLPNACGNLLPGLSINIYIYSSSHRFCFVCFTLACCLQAPAGRRDMQENDTMQQLLQKRDQEARTYTGNCNRREHQKKKSNESSVH